MNRLGHGSLRRNRVGGRWNGRGPDGSPSADDAVFVREEGAAAAKDRAGGEPDSFRQGLTGTGSCPTQPFPFRLCSQERPGLLTDGGTRMIARVWQGIVPAEKAEAYGRYLAESDLGVRGYRAIRGNRGVSLLRRVEEGQVRFLLISLWDSEKAIRDYAGADIERARYFDFDRECLLDPDPNVAHYEILVGPGVPEGAGERRGYVSSRIPLISRRSISSSRR